MFWIEEAKDAFVKSENKYKAIIMAAALICLVLISNITIRNPHVNFVISSFMGFIWLLISHNVINSNKDILNDFNAKKFIYIMWRSFLGYLLLMVLSFIIFFILILVLKILVVPKATSYGVIAIIMIPCLFLVSICYLTTLAEKFNPVGSVALFKVVKTLKYAWKTYVLSFLILVLSMIGISIFFGFTPLILKIMGALPGNQSIVFAIIQGASMVICIPITYFFNYAIARAYRVAKEKLSEDNGFELTQHEA